MKANQKVKYAVLSAAVVLSALSFVAMAGTLHVGTALAASHNTTTSSDDSLNGTGTEFSEALIEEPAGGSTNTSSASPFALGEEGFGGNTTMSELGTGLTIDTSNVTMHLDLAESAMQTNDTAGAVTHIIEALRALDDALTGSATSTASTSSNMTSSHSDKTMTMSNSTSMFDDSYGRDDDSSGMSFDDDDIDAEFGDDDDNNNSTLG